MTEAEWLVCDDPELMIDWISGRDRDRKFRLWVEACRSVYASPDSPWPQNWEDPNMFRGALAFWAGKNPLTGTVSCNLLRDIVGNPFRPVTLPAGPDCPKCHGTGTYWLTPTRGSDCPRCKGSGHQACPWLTSQVLSLAQAAYEVRPGRECGRCYGTGYDRRVMGLPVLCPDCHGTGRIEDGHLDSHRLMVLADALEEAGCVEESLLRHLRGQPLLYRMRCECGGELALLKKDMLPLLSTCKGCHKDGGFWADVERGIKSGPHVRGCWVLDLILEKS